MASCCKHRFPSSIPRSSIPTRGLPTLPLAVSLQDFHKKVAGVQLPDVGHLLTTGPSKDHRPHLPGGRMLHCAYRWLAEAGRGSGAEDFKDAPVILSLGEPSATDEAES